MRVFFIDSDKMGSYIMYIYIVNNRAGKYIYISGNIAGCCRQVSIFASFGCYCKVVAVGR